MRVVAKDEPWEARPWLHVRTRWYTPLHTWDVECSSAPESTSLTCVPTSSHNVKASLSAAAPHCIEGIRPTGASDCTPPTSPRPTTSVHAARSTDMMRSCAEESDSTSRSSSSSTSSASLPRATRASCARSKGGDKPSGDAGAGGAGRRSPSLFPSTAQQPPPSTWASPRCGKLVGAHTTRMKVIPHMTSAMPSPLRMEDVHS